MKKSNSKWNQNSANRKWDKNKWTSKASKWKWMFLVLKSMVIKSIAVRIHVEHTRLNARQKNSVAKYTYGYSSKYTYTTNTSIDMGINVRGISRSVSCLYVRLTLYAPPIQLGFYLLTSSKIHWFSSLRLMWRMCVLVQMMMPVLCCAVQCQWRRTSFTITLNTLSHLDSTLQQDSYVQYSLCIYTCCECALCIYIDAYWMYPYDKR